MDEFVIVVDIAGIIVGILGIYAYGPTVKEFVLPCGLHKGVTIPKAFAITPNIIHDGSWYAALGIVVIELEFPKARVAIVVIDSGFHANSVDVAVLATSMLFVWKLLSITTIAIRASGNCNYIIIILSAVYQERL